MGEAGGGVEGEEGEERGRASGRSSERANGPQPLARNAISCRYFRSGLGGGLAWKGAAKPKNNGIHPSACATLISLFHEAPKGFVVSA
jgi:hypothetical protein